ncbi:hypothetical protein U9M48_001108 [Paspalum notatum var. saurae]|uniref:Uncharacterized protein n=1 Tax=Paspalum notatum var. saurae TaxID=547442 RepID=A0AAQ3PIX3_PASNO
MTHHFPHLQLFPHRTDRRPNQRRHPVRGHHAAGASPVVVSRPDGDAGLRSFATDEMHRAKVLFRGTFWLRQWAKLQRHEEQVRLTCAAQNLEEAGLRVFNSFGWSAPARISYV